jgi:CBS-domain-containing membrane protein
VRARPVPEADGNGSPAWDFLTRLTARHERSVDHASNIKAGIAAIVGMLAVGYLAYITGQPLLLAPLGSTSVLLFAQPSSPLAQPVNVMMGFLVGAVVCEAVFYVLPGTWLAAAVSVGLAIIVMRALRVTHPPAGALPIMAFGQGLHGVQLFAIVFVGCAMLVLLALVVHRIPPRREYPLRSGPASTKLEPGHIVTE